MDKRLIIAIDGPAASGKSTTARLLAERLGYLYIDTGAMYRCCALRAMQLKISLADIEAISNMMDSLNLEISQSTDGNRLIMNGCDVSNQIRDEVVSKMASDISSLGEVRVKMVDLQRKLGASGGVVLDGRDIGTVVFPNADIKFYMIASVNERAQRRYRELLNKNVEVNFDTVLSQLIERDYNDSNRALAPLKPADDAITVDTSDLSIEEQVNKLYQYVLTKQG